jgi:serine phosphatase RsbU (regulator of sigma subunit)
MFTGVTYEAASLNFSHGDILAIVTDGLTEVFNSHQEELGESYIEDHLLRLASEPLSAIATSIIETAHRFGKIVDDQTLLLIRRHDPS